MKKRVNLSQSFIKSLTKVYDNSECGRKVQELYIDKLFSQSSSQAALNGQYFEYLLVYELTGQHITDRNGKTPEPPKTATGNISKTENQRIESQVQNVLKIFKEYDIEILGFSEVLEYKFTETPDFEFWRKGILDLRVIIKNYYTIENGYKINKEPFEAIIDLKYSGNLSENTKRSEYSFYTDPNFNLYEDKTYINSLENKDNLTIQAVEYKHLAKKILNKDLPFFFLVASAANDRDVEFIEVDVSKHRFDRHENNIKEIAKILNFKGCKLPASPCFSKCSNCENPNCEERVNVVNFKKITI